MLADLKQKHSETAPPPMSEEDELERFMREKDGEIARLEQEREWLKEENKRRKPDRSTFLTSERPSRQSPGPSESDIFTSKLNISQVIEDSSGYQESSDAYSYKPSLDSIQPDPDPRRPRPG